MLCLMSFSLSIVITLLEDWCQNGINKEKGWDQEKNGGSETRDLKGFYWYRDKFVIEESFDIFATHPTSKKSDLKQIQKYHFKGDNMFGQAQSCR